MRNPFRRRGSRPPEPTSEAAEQDPLRLVFVPPLLTLLVARERALGRELEEREVLAIRDAAAAVALPIDAADELDRRRGYADLDPDDCWRQWRIAREEIADEPGAPAEPSAG